ncbi:expressed unknown protein [Seminavis robusta]|uniref:Glycosyltransferase 61 catalytic domain-containing protein n=1 Tax=Seminavis robusta TaxID=568900 RepID=A0A9N8DZW5_9STRA|nr:expressed unknown protein [Seminavis robusta]|eukprot:Sro410_g137390.1 n/a (469) ;mRNA; f:32057-33547
MRPILAPHSPLRREGRRKEIHGVSFWRRRLPHGHWRSLLPLQQDQPEKDQPEHNFQHQWDSHQSLWEQAQKLAAENDLSPYETGNYTAEYALTEFLAGPAAPYYDAHDNHKLVFPMGDQKEAICEFQHHRNGSHHFPHSMQQLLRCFSWWQANPHQTPVLLFDREKLVKQKAKFVLGFLRLLQDAFGVSIVRHKNTTTIAKSVYTLTEGRNPVRRSKRRGILKDQNRIYYQMRSTQDAQQLRQGLLQHYPNITTSHAGCGSSVPKIGILNRQCKDHTCSKGSGRRIQNRPAISSAIKKALLPHSNNNSNNTNNNPIHYLSSFDGMSFLEQVTFMSNIDILISPHGAQLTGSAFLPSCGGILELFPRGYHFPDFFGTLAAATGHFHRSIYTGRHANRTRDVDYFSSTPALRKQTRLQPVHAHPPMVALAVRELMVQWQSCCQQTRTTTTTTTQTTTAASVVQQITPQTL